MTLTEQFHPDAELCDVCNQGLGICGILSAIAAINRLAEAYQPQIKAENYPRLLKDAVYYGCRQVSFVDDSEQTAVDVEKPLEPRLFSQSEPDTEFQTEPEPELEPEVVVEPEPRPELELELEVAAEPKHQLILSVEPPKKPKQKRKYQKLNQNPVLEHFPKSEPKKRTIPFYKQSSGTFSPEESRATARNLIERSLPIHIIVQRSRLSEAEVRQLILEHRQQHQENPGRKLDYSQVATIATRSERTEFFQTLVPVIAHYMASDPEYQAWEPKAHQAQFELTVRKLVHPYIETLTPVEFQKLVNTYTVFAEAKNEYEEPILLKVFVDELLFQAKSNL